jgi:hypothetical protein
MKMKIRYEAGNGMISEMTVDFDDGEETLRQFVDRALFETGVYLDADHSFTMDPHLQDGYIIAGIDDETNIIVCPVYMPDFTEYEKK